MKELITKITDFTDKLRWRTFYYDKDQMDTTNKIRILEWILSQEYLKPRRHYVMTT